MAAKNITGKESNKQTQQPLEEDNDVVCTNHFPCSFARNLTFYQYDAFVDVFNGKENKYINLTNREKRRRFVTDLLFTKELHSTAVCWYDESRCIYSTTDLSDKLPIVHEKEDQGQKFRLTIKSLTATSGTADLDHSSIRIIETLIKQALKEQFQAINQVFYRWNEKPGIDGPYDLRVGFRQALCLTESGPTLNVDTTITRFYPHCNMLQFIVECLLRQNLKNFPGWIEDGLYYDIENGLKDIEVTTLQSDHQKKYILTGRFADKLPGQTPINGHKNLSEYYKALGFELKYPQLYCLRAYKPGRPNEILDLPIELCSIREWQQVSDEKNVNPVKAPPAHERYRSIMESIRFCNFKDSALFKEINLQVKSNEMLTVPYGVLMPRDIVVGQRGRFLDPVTINQMAFIYLTDRRRQNDGFVKDNLIKTFRLVASQQNVILPQQIPELTINSHPKLDEQLSNELSKLKEQKCEFILCLENCDNQDIHKLFKQIATGDLGLVSQCVNYFKISRARNMRSYCLNLLHTINAKLSGENKRVTQLETPVRTMFIGADVQHAKNNYKGEIPSIAAVVASMNSVCTQTTQRASRQWPKDGRQSEESILLLKEMVEQLLIAYKECNSGALPQEIVFYRDGVDDGQLERVMDEEVTAVRQAIESIYPKGTARPQLMFLVVKKRHNTRLFRILPSSRVENVESGVIVDSNIVHDQSNYPNFFLNSHEPRLGTNKIGNYVVLINEPAYPLTDLEEMTYSLCYTDQRTDSKTSESIPSILHLADATASKARQLFANQPEPINGQRAEILEIHSDMINTPHLF